MLSCSFIEQIMDSLALHLPPEKIVTHVVKNSTQALSSEKPSDRKAGYVALGIIAEGCSDHITTKYVPRYYITAKYVPSIKIKRAGLFTCI